MKEENNVILKAEYAFRNTSIYKKAFAQAMSIFHLTVKFPKDEKYSLVDQIRRSTRSICANYAEAHRKRRYRAHFIAKLSDCDMENTETLVWLDFAYECKYITKSEYEISLKQNEEVGKLLGHALSNPDKY